MAVERVMGAAGALRNRTERAVVPEAIAGNWRRSQATRNVAPESSPRPRSSRPLSPNNRLHQPPATVTPLEASGAPTRPEAGRTRAQVKRVVSCEAVR